MAKVNAFYLFSQRKSTGGHQVTINFPNISTHLKLYYKLLKFKIIPANLTVFDNLKFAVVTLILFIFVTSSAY
jgi:hypothetical protein